MTDAAVTDLRLARALFEPDTIALVGVSGDPGRNTARPFRYLKSHGWKGRVIPINPGRDEVLGEKAWPDLRSAADALGRPIEDERAGYDLRLITYREVSHTKSRTAANYWLLALLPENSILMNARDAGRRGLEDGDPVRIRSASNPAGVWDFKNGRTRPIEGRLKAIQGIRPGVVAFSLGHGHWAYGASDV
ncbi:MAG TPA: molybdopterin dinucleotide binding domain-containing protein, partial [Rhodospirillales bacterium]